MPPVSIAELRDRLVAAAAAWPTAQQRACTSTATDEPLRLGAVHEWFGLGPGPCSWQPPLGVMIDIARSALVLTAGVVWIGRACWPYPRSLDATPDLLNASVFVDPPDDASRLWAIDTAARCASPLVVIADGSRLRLVHTRRLQLAAAAGGALCVLARPPGEEAELSAATTRWRVDRCASPAGGVRWAITPLRNKDRPVRTDDTRSTVVEWNDAQGLVRVSAPLADRADHASAAAG